MFENCLNSPIFWKRLAEKQEEGEQGRRHEFEKRGGGTESLKNCLPPWAMTKILKSTSSKTASEG